MEQVLLIGAGGHAQVIADLMFRAHEAGAAALPIGYLDDNQALRGEYLLGLPVLGSIEELGTLRYDSVLIAIGDNQARRRLYDRLLAAGASFATARHPSAVIAPATTLGAGSVVCAGAILGTGAQVGPNVILNTRCTVDHHCHIGAHSHIAPGVTLGGAVQVSEGALVGIGATVMPQRRIGAWSTVGAGALVCTDLEQHTVAVGIPARALRNGIQQ